MFDRSVQFPQRYQLQKVAGTDDIYDIIPAPGEIQNEGTLINKSTLLTDAVASMFGFGASAVPNDMFNVLTHAGDLHVWKRTIESVVDYPVHPDRNAYQEGTAAKPAGYTLGDVKTGSFRISPNNQLYTSGWEYASAISVKDSGEVSLSSPKEVNIGHSFPIDELSPMFKNKFVKCVDGANYTSFSQNQIIFIPSDVQITKEGQSYYIDKYQTVTGYAAIPAGITIEALGKLGDKRFANGKYVGTGTSYVSFKLTDLEVFFGILVIESQNGDKLAFVPIRELGGVGTTSTAFVISSGSQNITTTTASYGNNYVTLSSSLINVSGTEYTYYITF